MGTWGTGLYEDDRAADLRASLKVVCKLPLEPSRLLELLLENEGPADSLFWLVVADQFSQKGVDCPEALARGRDSIESDLSRCASLGMAPALLEKRRQALQALSVRWRESKPSNRATMGRPQPLLMEAGQIWAYPTAAGKPINPYLKAQSWSPDGWAATLIVEAEQLFGYLAWYRPVVAQRVWTTPPELAEVVACSDWRLCHAATCPSAHFKKLGLVKLGEVKLGSDWRGALLPTMMSGKNAALSDISISNRLKVEPKSEFGRISKGALFG